MDKQKWTCIELDWISFPFQRTANLIYTQHSLAPFLLMSQKIEIKGTSWVPESYSWDSFLLQMYLVF